MDVKKMDDQGVARLCEAVILKAVDDYRVALVREHLIKSQEGRNSIAGEIRVLEKFFNGDLFKLYAPKLDGDMLMKMIREELIEYDYDLDEIRKSHKLTTALN